MSITIKTLEEMKKRGEKVALLTAYDYPTAVLEDKMGVEIIVVGDSFGMTVMGQNSTLFVTMNEMLVSARAVRQGVKNAMVIADMPYMSFQPSNSLAIKNAGRFIQETGVDGVKIEGMPKRAKAIVSAGVPVMGHIGLLPQSIKRLQGYKVQGKTEQDAERIIEQAKELDEAGVFSIIAESIPRELTKRIKESVQVPIYGIGAGPDCDGQILVVNDLLGLYSTFAPKFVKKYANLTPIIEKAFEDYIKEVKEGKFPDDAHSYH